MTNNIHGPICHESGIQGYGDPTHKLMFVGISPREAEIKANKPDQGPAGQLIDQILESIGWNPKHSYHTNAVCFMEKEPTPEQIKGCQPRLLQEIEAYKPRFVVCLGHTPADSFGIKHRGWVHSRSIHSHTFYIMYTYHPSSVFQGNHFVYDIVRDFQKIPLVMNPDWPIRFPTNSLNALDYEVIDDPIRAQKVLDNLSSNTRVALDIETRLHDPNTDDLDVFADDLRCLSLYDGESSVVFTNEACKDLRWPTTQTWTFHNGPFDIMGMQQYLNVNLPLVEDTQYLSYARDEFRGMPPKFRRTTMNKLEDLTAEYFGDIDYKTVTKSYWRKHIEPPAHDLHLRNAKDAFYTYHLVDILHRLEPCPAYKSLLIPGGITFAEIVHHGVYIDMKAHHDLAVEWGTVYIKLFAAIHKHVNNPSSPKQLSNYIYGEDGLALPGGPSTAKDLLKELDHPFTTGVVEMRNLEFLLKNWVYMLPEHIKRDGRLHPNVLLHGTETGRRSYHAPPMGTIPKHGEQLFKIRTLFAAPTEDHVIVEADYSQIEMFVAAYLSEDTQMLSDLTTIQTSIGKSDMHYATASHLGLHEIGTLTADDARQIGKTANFLMLYGGGAAKLQQTLGKKNIHVSLSFCQILIDSWRSHYSQFARWADKTWKQANDQGYISTPFGRYRRFPLITDPSWRSQVINFPVQSTAGDYTLSSIIELHPLLKPLDAHILFDVHDSIVLEVPRAYLDETLSLVRQVMETPKAGLGSVKVDIKVGAHL